MWSSNNPPLQLPLAALGNHHTWACISGAGNTAGNGDVLETVLPAAPAVAAANTVVGSTRELLRTRDGPTELFCPLCGVGERKKVRGGEGTRIWDGSLGMSPGTGPGSTCISTDGGEAERTAALSAGAVCTGISLGPVGGAVMAGAGGPEPTGSCTGGTGGRANTPLPSGSAGVQVPLPPTAAISPLS
mmetsp:Transcript_103492/g.309191  ORF Transcript_103492/g.309191 Transcript_103492/m.309191 type:complete len:188 (-) Transcript_103492:716-1279(-)